MARHSIEVMDEDPSMDTAVCIGNANAKKVSTFFCFVLLNVCVLFPLIAFTLFAFLFIDGMFIHG